VHPHADAAFVKQMSNSIADTILMRLAPLDSSNQTFYG
jgi:hypothetical protein